MWPITVLYGRLKLVMGYRMTRQYELACMTWMFCALSVYKFNSRQKQSIIKLKWSMWYLTWAGHIKYHIERHNKASCMWFTLLAYLFLQQFFLLFNYVWPPEKFPKVIKICLFQQICTDAGTRQNYLSYSISVTFKSGPRRFGDRKYIE